MTTLFPGVSVARCPACGLDVVWIAQDAPREVQDRFFSRVRRYELKIEHVTDKDFDEEAEWCRCGAKS